MTKVMVADAARDVRNLLVANLTDAGYDVVEARGGAELLDKAVNECPDIILLDLITPLMDGFAALGRLRENPATEAIPVIVLTALRPVKGESIGMRLGVTHYVTKPWAAGDIELAVRVVLREARTVTDDIMATPDSPLPQGSTSSLGTPDGFGSPTMIRTGNSGIDVKLRGGIPVRSLTLVEGSSLAGKSVLCQHLAYNALEEGHGVGYLTSEHTVDGLSAQMASLGLDVSAYLKVDRLLVHSMEQAMPGADPVLCDDPARLLMLLGKEIEWLPLECTVIIADSITHLAKDSSERDIIRFFSDCKRLGKDGRTIILVAHSVAFEEHLLPRLRALCDAHLSLRREYVGERLVNTLQVCKVGASELSTDNTISFEVEPGQGIRALPMIRAKA